MAASDRTRRAPRPVVVVPIGPGRRVADVLREQRVRLGEARAPKPSATRTLRISLAMRGGVSLAVWIGGVAAEVDLLRRIRLYDVGDETWALLPWSRGAEPSPAIEERVRAYAELLDAAGYDRVEVDLLAGASAGGLNAVVYAVAQRAGMSLDGLLRTWSTVGGFWGLLNEPGDRGIHALMRGEGYFRRRVRTAMGDLYLARGAHPDLVADYVGVDLSTTIIDAQDAYEEDASDGRGHFHFVGSDRHHLDNLVPRRAAPPYDGKLADDLEQLWQLALAARSTSSLAGGFEPAEIASTEWPGPGDPDDPGPIVDARTDPRGTVAARRDLRFAFGLHRAQPGQPYRVIDGAVFDNVPIDRALRAARLRPSERLADRALLFLDPEPDPPLGGPAPWDPDASRFFPALGAMFSRSFRRESVSGEVDELARFNALRLVADGRRQSTSALAAAAAATPDALAARRRAYVRAQGGAVADHLVETLAQPSLWQLHSPGRRRRSYPPVDRVALGALEAVAVERFARLAEEDPDRVLRSPSALADAASCVLDWARALESVPDAPGSRRGFQLRAVRRAAYDALIDATGSRDAATERVLLDRLATLPPRGIPARADAERWVDAWIAASDAVDAGPHWRALDAAIGELADLSRAVDARADAGEADLGAWPGSTWHAIHRVAAGLHANDLPPLLNAGGVPASLSHVTYWAIGVDEPPANPHRFTALMDDRFRTRLQGLLRTPRIRPETIAERLAAPELVPLDRQTKLAGYGFGNFLGFLAAEWRVNDWWWGRLDGAAGLARFLARGLSPDEVHDVVRRVQDQVLLQADEERYAADGRSPYGRQPGGDADRTEAPEPVPAAKSASPAAAPAAVPTSVPAAVARASAGPAAGGEADEPRSPADAQRARLRAGTDTLWNLDPSYRFALASRAVRLVDRSTTRPRNRVLLVAVQAVLAVLRPFLVAVPAVADPPRLALIVGISGAAAWLLTWTAFAPSPFAATFAWVLVVVAAVVLALGIARVRRLWGRAAAAADDPDLRTSIAAARTQARGPALRYGVVALASLVPLWVAVARSNLVMSVLCGAVTAVLIAVAVRMASTARANTVPWNVVRSALMLGAFALLGAVLPALQYWAEIDPAAPDLLAALLEPPLGWDLAILAVGGIAVAIVLTVDWLPIGGRRAAIRRSRGIDWLTLSVLASSIALVLGSLVLLATAGRPPLHGTITAVVVFIVAWANVVWWLPELRRRELPLDDGLYRRGEAGRPRPTRGRGRRPRTAPAAAAPARTG
ncbi:DUF3376 domain-containing protein [Agromyces sp. MMS24-JH15]|uniref:DUF3376 domain-containing protein n=1 Tax=Agromyces sp. MMS24-JH15 TaxID=3243765 RepID=UPI00374A773E